MILNRLGFFLTSHVSHSGFKGGLLLAWRFGVELEYFLSNMNTVSVWCYSDPPHKPWILSCTYRYPYSNHKFKLWDSLATVGKDFS
jgi:hypothetical protein